MASGKQWIQEDDFPTDHPLREAWLKFKDTEEFRDMLSLSGKADGVYFSRERFAKDIMWQAFLAGSKAG